ncbi:MAG: hypothetical protein LBK04_03950, partial [Clostridiales Family XIII bacterium]|nr:hypothetical protein [Clostridiales Family XIII bacterium]
MRAESSDGGYLTYEWHRSKGYGEPQTKSISAFNDDGSSVFTTDENFADSSLIADGSRSVLDFKTPAVDETTYYYYWATVTNHVDSNGDGVTTGDGEEDFLDSGVAEVKVVDRTLQAAIVNGGFEEFTGTGNRPIGQVWPRASFPYRWETTHDYRAVSGGGGGTTVTTNIDHQKNSVWRTGLPSPSGDTYSIELNAHVPSTVYQEVATIPGKIYEWQFQHATRQNNNSRQDAVALVIGPAINDEDEYGLYDSSETDFWQKGNSYKLANETTIDEVLESTETVSTVSDAADETYPYGTNINTLFSAVVYTLAGQYGTDTSTLGTSDEYRNKSHAVTYKGKQYFVFIASTPYASAFVTYKGAYSVPQGQGTTVFGWVAVSWADNSNSGNVLNNVSFQSGTGLSPEQDATYSGDSSISIATKAGYAYALAEVRGSSVNELTGLQAYYSTGTSALPIKPTAGLGLGGWYTTDSATGDGGTPFANGGTIIFRDLMPGKTYRIIGIPAGAINEGLQTNMSPSAVLDNGYYSDIKLVPASGGDEGSSLPSYTMEVYGDLVKRVRLAFHSTNVRVQYALLAEDGDGKPVTTGPALPGTAWTDGTGGSLVFEGLSPDTGYYLVARPRGYTEITYDKAAYSDTGTLVAQKITTPAPAAVDVKAEDISRPDPTTITIDEAGAQAGYTYAAVDPVTGAIVKRAVASGSVDVSFTGLDASKAYQVVASPITGSYLPGVRVYPYASAIAALDINYAEASVGTGPDGANIIPPGIEYRVMAGSGSSAVYIVGDENTWMAFPGTERLDLTDSRMVVADKLDEGTPSMSIFDALDTLGAGQGSIVYRTAISTDYSGPAVRPELTLAGIPARPAAPTTDSYEIDYINEEVGFTGSGLQWAQPGSESWAGLDDGDSLPFAGTNGFNWTGAAEKTIRLRTSYTQSRFTSEETTVTVVARPAAPATLGAHLKDSENLGAGIVITGLITGRDYQYKESKLNEWTSFTAGGSGEKTLTYGAGHDDYDIRYAATGDKPASFFITVSSPLNVETINFDQKVYGTDITGEAIAIHNIVLIPVDISATAVTLEGGDKEKFELNAPGEKTIDAGEVNKDWIIAPKSGIVLDVGSYHTTVVVTYGSGDKDDYTASANVYLEVTPAEWGISGMTAVISQESESGFTVTANNPPAGAALSFSEASGHWVNDAGGSSYTFTNDDGTYSI